MSELSGFQPVVYNTTRYNTEDIKQICLASWSGWLPSRLVVSYYTPSKSAKNSYSESTGGQGLFVKLLRNGDEKNNVKELKLIKPTRFDGVSDLEQIVAATSGEAPPDLIRQVMHRCYLLRRWRGNDGGPPWVESIITDYKKKEMDKVIERKKLRLRFEAADPSTEVLDWRLRLSQLLECRNQKDAQLSDVARGIAANQKSIDSAVRQVERLTVQQAKLQKVLDENFADIKALLVEGKEFAQ